jgi:hypothetical protein
MSIFPREFDTILVDDNLVKSQNTVDHFPNSTAFISHLQHTAGLTECDQLTEAPENMTRMSAVIT